MPVILSGGSGTRLWPASRRRQPKQRLPRVDDRSLFRATIERAARIPGTEAPLVVANADQRAGIVREMRSSGHNTSHLILEPVGRNTAPAVAAAAIELSEPDDDPLLLVLPADHVIGNEEAFIEAVALAASAATDGHLVTFGITPTAPETGYGYIRFGATLRDGVRFVEAFREKPDRHTAEEYVGSGEYLWNSGMFLFGASAYLAELNIYSAPIATAVRLALALATRADNEVVLDGESFAASPATSVDYAVMEHTAHAAVVPLHAGWSDIGSWSALWDIGEHDDGGNVTVGDVLLIDVHNTYVRAEGRLVSAIGVDNLVVVDSADAVLVTRRDRAQDVANAVAELRSAGRPEPETDGRENRLWGRFETLEAGPGFRVLRLWLEPGARTSLQTHSHRSEHWIVVRGTATIERGGETRLVPANESMFVPPGVAHRLENAHESEILEVIQVDVGTDVADEKFEVQEGEPGGRDA